MSLLTEGRCIFPFTEAEALRPDAFTHEQSLLLREGEKLVLLGGCAHRGITNIIARAETVAGRAPDAVFAGFHMTNPGLGVDEDTPVILRAGETLKAWPCAYYTGHCTGEGPYRLLEDVLGQRMTYMGCGCSFEVR